ncbi:MAG: hypothetical protein WDZ80_04265 [Candidatus Paceibacterota bacterium]
MGDILNFIFFVRNSPFPVHTYKKEVIMEKEIEIARLVNYFVRDRLDEEELDQLFTLLYEDPDLLDYIMVEFMVYEYGLQIKRPI